MFDFNSPHLGIVPASGNYGSEWPANFVIPQGNEGSMSVGGWTIGNEGFPQQTFLGASIRNFSVNAGFGDSSSNVSVELVNDEYNKSDKSFFGRGDDPYHDGQNDLFRPPAVGSPVFFKFGTNPATVEQAWRKTFDDTYGYNTISNDSFAEYRVQRPLESLPPFNFVDLSKSNDESFYVIDKSSLLNPDNEARGRNHFVFGGILQSYTENNSSEGRGLYTVNVVDPREVLSNAQLLFNNYQGTTYNNKNLFNIYGFLEYDPRDSLVEFLDNAKIDKGYLSKRIDASGNIVFSGNGTNPLLLDQYEFKENANQDKYGAVTSTVYAPGRKTKTYLPKYFPITGQGLSRRSERGIPFYRVSQALATLFESYGSLPQEYIDAGFGGKINFRGYNYVVDFGGIPTQKIPSMYFMDFDQLDMLSFAQELCDVISHELFVSMLPIINHPACAFLENYNQQKAIRGEYSEMVAGIIRRDAIDKTQQPSYGAIIQYLKDLKDRGIEVENQDLGFELSNVTTDKFVVGAQEVEMYFFDTTHDRDDLQVRKEDDGQSNVEILQQEQWLLETSLKQSVLPFYGFLGDGNAVTIPRGWGSYQQILLDTRGLNAFGVGNYYVATELELRAALVSYDRWKNFLLKYSETYIQDIEEYGATFSALADANDQINDVLEDFKLKTQLTEDTILGSGFLTQLKNRQFAVTVPRCVWDSDRPLMGNDGLPASPCSPPFGYPLYYGRAKKIGIPEAGVLKIINAKNKVITNYAQLQDRLSGAATMSSITPEFLEEKLKLLLARVTDFEENWRATHPQDLDGYADNETYKGYMAEIEKFKQVQEEYTSLQNMLINEGEDLLAETKNTLEGLAEDSLIAKLPQIAKNHKKNAMKVYEFIKKVAEENLGKRFLVKIPKACNVRYQPNTVTYDQGQREKQIAAGPFGFSPMPISSNIDVLSDVRFKDDIEEVEETITAESLFIHYNNYKINLNDESLSPNGTENNHEASYTYGALKNNYNPITDKWEFNYKPEPLGGFMSYELLKDSVSSAIDDYGSVLDGNFGEGLEDYNLNIRESDLPQSMQDLLYPVMPWKLLNENNSRIGCYVRYDNSHLLSFVNVPPESLIQQSYERSRGGHTRVIPDVVELLPNVQPDQEFSFNQKEERDKDNEKEGVQPAVAFVKCEVDEQFYMPPKLQLKNKEIYARNYELRVSTPPLEIVEDVDEDGCPTFSLEFKRIDPVFSIAKRGGADGTYEAHTDFVRNSGVFWQWEKGVATFEEAVVYGNIIDTSPENLDSNHVYALITLPGRVETTLDQRWADGPMQVNNTVEIKNLMTQDVVKIPAFNKPSFPEKTERTIDCEKDELDFSLAELTEVERIQRQALKGVKFNQGETAVQFIQPSPIYPSMVAMPLLSWERCYGPWMSSSSLNPEDSRVRYSNIGGRIDFLKDENLAPWNFGGYTLLNEAGRLQAEFSNSLLLISERGGFVYPSAPSGIALAKALKAGGPLVTSIDVQIGDSVKTTVKLDLYTPSYGKLHKQKEGNIATIARERQKVRDQNNSLIRIGINKWVSGGNLMHNLMAKGGQKILDLAKSTDTFFSDVDKRSSEKLLLASDGIQTRVVEESQLIRGLESYNTAAQAQSFISPGGGPMPIVEFADLFDVVNNIPTTSQHNIPGADIGSAFGIDASLAERFFGNANEGDN